jgi:hypothetical protein
MATVILASLVLAHILVVWFQTDAFVEYAILFGLAEQCKVKQYLETIKDNPWSFPEFLNELYQKHFFVRVLSCPVCLATWLSLPLVFATPYFLGVAFLGLILYELHILVKSKNA